MHATLGFERARRYRRAQGIAIIGGLVVAGLSANACKADAISDFYVGKTVTISVGLGPGGGYDVYARTIARHLGRKIPGSPNIVVKNVPGAAGLSLIKSLYNVLPRDGTEIATFNRTIPLDPLLGDSKSIFDPLKLSWIGSPSNEVSTCVGWHTAKVKNIEDLQTTELLVPGTGSAADSVIYPALLQDVLGFKFKVINGYQGTADSLLALERGEVDGYCPWGWASIEATRPAWLRDKKINIFMQLGMKKHPAHPDVPFVLDMAKSPDDRQALELLMSPHLFARPFAAPPGVPSDRLTALREAFAQTIHDPEFLDEAKRSQLEVDYVSGEQIQEILQRLYNTPADIVNRVKKAISSH